MSDPFVVAVEASRLAQEVRGIGREVWALLPRLLRQRPTLRLVLMIRRSADVDVVRRRLAELDAPLDRVSFASLGKVDRVSATLFWYPWNVSLPAPRRGVVVATIQDVAPLVLPDPRRRKWLKNFRWRRRYGYTARRADMIIAISRFTSDEVHRVLHVPYERMRVTLLAADDLRIPPAERDAEALARLGVHPPYVLAVGAADRRKNLGLLERAMPRVAAAFPQTTLVLAGPRRGRAQRRGDPSWQRTLGFVSEEDLVTLYRGARVVVAPSSYEGFGLPVLEAMQLGAPVICARASSLPEAAGDAAVYVEPDDDAALAREIGRIIGSEEVFRSLREASLAQSARFSWDETARLTLAAFDDAVAAAASRGGHAA
jgi:glycosyltransferase involved in cell wall biosynthesis